MTDETNTKSVVRNVSDLIHVPRKEKRKEERRKEKRRKKKRKEKGRNKRKGYLFILEAYISWREKNPFAKRRIPSWPDVTLFSNLFSLFLNSYLSICCMDVDIM